MKEIENHLSLLRNRISDIMETQKDDFDLQKQTIRLLIGSFARVGKDKNLPLMIELLSDILILDYPQFKPEIEKLLILL